MSAADKMTHIPAIGFDMAQPELYANVDVLETFKILREEDPIHFAETRISARCGMSRAIKIL